MQRKYENPIFNIMETEDGDIVTLSLGDGPGNEGGPWGNQLDEESL